MPWMRYPALRRLSPKTSPFPAPKGPFPRACTAPRPAAGPGPAALAEDFTIPGPQGAIPARLYRPRAGGRSLPVVLYFHGGGFVGGCLDVADVAAPGGRANSSGERKPKPY